MAARRFCAGGFNPFGDANARALSPQCQAFITKDAFSKEILDQTQFQGQVNGSLFDLGAGVAQLAIVADYRRNTLQVSLPMRISFRPGRVQCFRAEQRGRKHRGRRQLVAGSSSRRSR